MQRTRLLMIGGFLGAGKTTAISRLAQHYTDQGLRVGVVTNDQAYGLVDTRALRAQGLDVAEVPGACFCCKFDELVETAAALGADGQPDIILTEPVGSCTDLMATVIYPLQHLYGDRYEVGPLAVLCKPEHGRKILGGQSGGFSPQAAYIFRKQLEEAQLVVLNKIDRLGDGQRRELLDLLRENFPDKRVLAVSATGGEGFDELIAELADASFPYGEALEIDYDTYAEGDAALGWLNCAVRFGQKQQDQPDWPLDDVTQALVRQFSKALVATDMEPGHVKVFASSGTATAIANWVASDAPVELSVPSSASVRSADLLVNVRVEGDPQSLAELVGQAIDDVARQYGLRHEISSLQHFRPGRPEPQHRYASPRG